MLAEFEIYYLYYLALKNCYALYYLPNIEVLKDVYCLYAVSVCLQTWGSIFPYGFLGEVQFKKSLKSELFDQKMGFYCKKPPKTGLLKKGEGLFKSEAV